MGYIGDIVTARNTGYGVGNPCKRVGLKNVGPTDESKGIHYVHWFDYSADNAIS